MINSILNNKNTKNVFFLNFSKKLKFLNNQLLNILFFIYKKLYHNKKNSFYTIIIINGNKVRRKIKL